MPAPAGGGPPPRAQSRSAADSRAPVSRRRRHARRHARPQAARGPNLAPGSHRAALQPLLFGIDEGKDAEELDEKNGRCIAPILQGKEHFEMAWMCPRLRFFHKSNCPSRKTIHPFRVTRDPCFRKSRDRPPWLAIIRVRLREHARLPRPEPTKIQAASDSMDDHSTVAASQARNSYIQLFFRLWTLT